jgi:phage gpG-like protein
MRFEVNYTNPQRVQKAFEGVFAALSGASRGAILGRIGEHYKIETKHRFDKQYNVDRKRWPRNTETTIKYKTMGPIAGYPKAVRGPFHVGIWKEKLQKSIDYRINGNEVWIGSNVPYARVFQKGAKTGTIHSYIGANGKPVNTPWGDIPPRPFLGRNKRIDEKIMGIVHDELASKIGIPSQTGRRYL